MGEGVCVWCGHVRRVCVGVVCAAWVRVCVRASVSVCVCVGDGNGVCMRCR